MLAKLLVCKAVDIMLSEELFEKIKTRNRNTVGFKTYAVYPLFSENVKQILRQLAVHNYLTAA